MENKYTVSIKELPPISSALFYSFDQKESIWNIHLLKGQNIHVNRSIML